jgi:hypothetical protein
MKKIINIIITAVFALNFISCADYLDIVPDNTITIEDYFERREMAWEALAKVYSYLPNDPNSDASSWMLGDEWIGRIDQELNAGYLRGIKIMQGLQNTNDPLLGHWTGSAGGKSLYQGIRSANIFLEYIDMVEDMTKQEKDEWKGQVKFLKAYYHFLLLRQYGPIVIMDKSVPLDALSEDLFHKRSKVEECFDYIIGLMNEAIPDIQERTDETELGLIDRVGAMAVKARVMLYRASPFYNENGEYFGDFFDFDRKTFFPITGDKDIEKRKWKDAADAAQEAINLCLANGLDLYEYEEPPYVDDRDDYAANSKMKTLYDLRMVVADPWNRELLWGQTYEYSIENLVEYTNIRLPTGYIGVVNNTYMSRQTLCASYAMVERYYTKNGVPIEEDLTFNRTAMYDIVTTPATGDEQYAETRGIMQPGEKTLRLYLNRELRFYANLGITGGYWRAHTQRVRTLMTNGAAGGFEPRHSTTDFFCTGIGVQKLVHPESKSGGWTSVIRSPYPIIRMADLYLMKAEALNEYLDAPTDEIYEAVNKVRTRAGLRGVKETWSDASIVRTAYLNKHTTKEGMKDIILRERSIEFAFEGANRFWDMYRHKRAVAEFSAPIMGWKYEKVDVTEFFVLEAKQPRRFTIKDYLWPISLGEINKNANLIQNPGW